MQTAKFQTVVGKETENKHKSRKQLQLQSQNDILEATLQTLSSCYSVFSQYQTGGLLETQIQGDPETRIGPEELFQELNQTKGLGVVRKSFQANGEK